MVVVHAQLKNWLIIGRVMGETNKARPICVSILTITTKKGKRHVLSMQIGRIGVDVTVLVEEESNIGRVHRTLT